MGLRGPGAKAIKRTATAVAEPTPDVMPWQRKGLTRAGRVIAFMESLPITSGAHTGRPFKVRPWQRRFLQAVYATDRKGLRTVRTAVLSMGRKNGKSDVAARLALCHLCGPEAEERGEVYSAANDKFQAGRLFGEMVAIIERVPWMTDRVSIRRHSKELEDIGGTGSIYAALSSDVPSKMGLSPSCVVVDELGSAPNRNLYDALDTAIGARFEPLLIVISTQAPRDDAPLSELIDYGLRIQRGEVVDASFHLTLYAAPADAKITDPDAWAAANPALGDFRSREDVERLARQAERMPSREASFRNLILNQRVNAEDTFLTAAVWKPNCGAIDHHKLAGRDCWGGLDLGASRDMTALVLAFADDAGGFDVLTFPFLPGDDLAERAEEDRAPYTVWRDQGYLEATPGKTMNPALIARRIAELHGRYGLKALAYDRWRIADLRRELDAIGCEIDLIPFGQGFKELSPAIDAFERLVVDGKLRTDAHPTLTFAVANAVTEADAAGNRKVTKAKSRGRIDPLVAALMAIGIATRREGNDAWEPTCEMV